QFTYYLYANLLRIALQWITPPATAGGLIDQLVAGLNFDLVTFGRQNYPRAIGAHQDLRRTQARPAAKNAPRGSQPTLIMDGDLAGFEEGVPLGDAVAATV